MPAAFTVDFCFDKKRRRKKVFALTRLCKSFLCLPALLLGWLVGWHTVLLPFGTHHWWVVVVVRLKPNISDFAILSNSRCRPLWHQAAVNDIRPSGGGGVHHPNIVGAPKHSLCYSLQIWANNKARSMFSMLCALSGSESFNDKVKFNSDVGSGWILDLWPMDLVQTFIVCLVWSAHPSQKDSIDWADAGARRDHRDPDGTLITMGVQGEGGSTWSQWGSRLRAPKPKHPTVKTRRSRCSYLQSTGRLRREESRHGLLSYLPFLLVGLFYNKKSCQMSGQRQSNVATAFTTGMPSATSYFSSLSLLRFHWAALSVNWLARLISTI